MEHVDAPSPEVAVPPSEHLAYEEVVLGLDGLTPLDLARLDAIERRHLDGTDFAEGDLLQEAMGAALCEQKACPRGVSFIAFLAQSMRNIAGRRRKQLLRQVPPEEATTGEGKLKSPLRDAGPGPEEASIQAEQDRRATEVWATLSVHYGPDEEMSMVLLGWENDMRGEELRDFVGVDQARLDYVIKKIRRIGRREYPRGWRI
jgi:DNA-directed RNA polymerase specialized sigma24 family protein